MTFRIKFAKYGVVRYIGHLDVMRYFQKVIRRSGLPVSYSQGFSPHQLMSFALPLSVGVTSDGEYMEVEFDDERLAREAGGPDVKADDLNIYEKYIFDGLASHTTEGFAILAVKQLPKPVPNKHQDKAMALVSAADYLISVKDGYEDCIGFKTQDEFMRAFEKFIGQETIEVIKKTKKNEKQLNLKEFIYGYGDGTGIFPVDKTAEAQRSQEETDSGKQILNGTVHARRFANGMQLALRLAAGSVVNIKPEMVLEAFLGSFGREYNENAFAMHRIELYMGGIPDLKPLVG